MESDSRLATRATRGRLSRVAVHDRLLPDLSDPATLGCLLALVREAWGDPGASAGICDDLYWEVGGVLPGGGRGSFEFHGATEAEALVAALEAAPRPEGS